MKKILSFTVVAIFILSIASVAYAEDECPKPPQVFCAEGEVVGMFKDDSGCTITKCVEKTENTVYCWNEATCVNGATWLNAFRCAVDSDCVCGGMDLNSGKCYVGNKAYYDVNVDKTKDCSDFCRLDERSAKCVKNYCTLVSLVDPAVAANPTACFTNLEEGTCCIGGVCKTAVNDCTQGLTTKFLGCSDTCTPIPECVGVGGVTGNPTAISGEKPIVSTIINPAVTSVNNCPTSATPSCNGGKVLGVFKDDNGCPIFKCVDMSENNPVVTAAAFPAVCFDESLNRQVLEINKKLGEAKDDTQIADLKTKLENINAEILQKKDECAQKKQHKQEQQYAQETTKGQAVPRGVAVGQVCEVSEDLRIKQDGAWKVYKDAIENGDDAAIASAKAALETINIEIQSARRECMDTIVPGQIKTGGGQGKIAECKVPQELYTKLEGLWKKSREISGDAIPPAGMKEQITQVEEEIRTAKATCNAAFITPTTNSQDLADGYKERIASTISSTDSTEAKIQSLKELRKEIDETIKNLIKEQKKFKFEEFKDLIDDVTVSPGSVEVGDAETESEDVEIETEIEGDNITVSTSDDFVLLEDGGLTVEASSVDISSDGITVDGTNLKVSPKTLLTKSKGLEQYKANAKVKIEKIKGKVQYRAEYQSQKKLFGFIPVTANNAVEVDATSGQVTSQEAPWWNGLATDDGPAVVATE
jgi:hypothetical protein